jgi:hypothetical protein
MYRVPVFVVVAKEGDPHGYDHMMGAVMVLYYLGSVRATVGIKSGNKAKLRLGLKK